MDKNSSQQTNKNEQKQGTEQPNDTVIEENVTLLYDIYVNKKPVPGQFVCPHPGCGKKYDTETSLNRHLVRHSTNKKHVCETCGKAFLRKSELEIHTRVHTGIKPYKCPICPKSFARVTDLRIHLVYHSDDKPFACPFPGCTLRYKRKSDCKKHIRQHLQKNNNDLCGLVAPVGSAFVPVPHYRMKIEKDCLVVLNDTENSISSHQFHSD